MMEVLEKIVPPGDQSQLVDFVDALSTLLALATNPVSEKVIKSILLHI
jgi:hypothetical protein